MSNGPGARTPERGIVALLLMAVRDLRPLCGAVSAAWANPWHRGAASTLVGVVALAVLLRSMPLSLVAQHLQPRHLTPLLAIVALTLLGPLPRAGRRGAGPRPRRSARGSVGKCGDRVGQLRAAVPDRRGAEAMVAGKTPASAGRSCPGPYRG